MTRRTIALFAPLFLFLGLFAWSGWYILDITELNPIRLPDPLSGRPKVIFGAFLMLCMVAGMVANYLWDLFRANGEWENITFVGLIGPLLISPIVFFSIWSVWKGEVISFSLPFIAFQNGFFWQVVFSKAQPRP